MLPSSVRRMSRKRYLSPKVNSKTKSVPMKNKIVKIPIKRWWQFWIRQNSSETYKEEFPYGCPNCKKKKPIRIKFPKFTINSKSKRKKKRDIEFDCICPNCKSKWIIEIYITSIYRMPPPYKPFAWIERYNDGSQSRYKVLDCEDCGALNSVFEDTHVNWRRWCKSCGTTTSESHQDW